MAGAIERNGSVYSRGTRVALAVSVAIALRAVAVAAAAAPCGNSGMTVLRADSGSGYIFYGFRSGPDFGFMLPRKQVGRPRDLSGRRMFTIDGISFESLVVSTSEFIRTTKGVSDLHVLEQHQAHEFGFIQKSPSPLKRLVVFGPREKPASNGQPGFTFYLWSVADPRDANGPRQYFLSTVSGGDVVVLTATVPNQAGEGVAMGAFDAYASSFQHVLNKGGCPDTTAR